MAVVNDWRDLYFSKKLCQGNISVRDYNEETNTYNVTITGMVKNNDPDAVVMYWAAAPPHRNYSFSGSGMPYARPEQAFDRSPNVGAVKTDNGRFTIKLDYPSAYYTNLGSLYVPPQVHLKICNTSGYDTVVLGEGMPYRTLTHPAPPTKNPRLGPEFYVSNLPLPIRGQETILRSAGYPKTYTMDDNFWGMKPGQ